MWAEKRIKADTKGVSSQIIISANRKHQAQENVYIYFFLYFGTSH